MTALSTKRQPAQRCSVKTVTKAFLRYLIRRPGLSVLQVLGIACGVAATVGMVLSSQAALTNFRNAVDFLKGNATHTLRRPAGPLAQGALRDIMRDPAVRAFAPVIDRRIGLVNGDLVRVLGIDVLLDRAVRPSLAHVVFEEGAADEEALEFMLREDTILLDSRISRKTGLSVGDRLETTRGSFYILGILTVPSGEPLLLMDIAHAQNLFALQGRIDYVELILDDGAAFGKRWESSFDIQSSRQGRAVLSEMLHAFRLNLEALSLLSLLVGVFLIYNTAMFTVVSRRKDAGILMTLGALRVEIAGAFLAEVVLLGAAGGTLGGGAGYVLGLFLTNILGTTISSLYFFLYADPPGWSWGFLLFGVMLGCGAGLLGALFPLLELLRTDPVKALHGRIVSTPAQASFFAASVAGIAVLAVCGVLILMSPLHVYIGFAGAFCLLMGISLLTGMVMVGVGPGLKKMLLCIGGLAGRLASGNISRNLGRTAVAAAAFMVALSMSVGLGVMISSFRSSLVWWMESQLSADLYVAPSPEIRVPEEFYALVDSVAGVRGTDRYRNVPITFRNQQIRITVIDAPVLKRFTRFRWMQADGSAWGRVEQGAVIVSESFFRRFGLGAGDSIMVKGIAGNVSLDIAGVFYDYTTEHGLIMMDRSTYTAVYDDNTIDSLGVFLAPDDPRRRDAARKIRTEALSRGLPVVTGKELQGNIMRVFDTTFSITRSMRVMAVIVAFFGIAGAILILFTERRREFGIYRALGFSRLQVGVMTLLESIGMGLVSLLLCAAAGTALAVVLIRVINLQCFNWTIFYHHDWRPYLTAAATALAASTGAALYPVWRICRTYPHMHIREE